MKLLEKRAKEFIMEQIRNGGEMSIEEMMDLVRPHIIFDSHTAKERELRRKVHSILAQIKDEDGQRAVYNYKTDDGESVYIDIDATKNIDALLAVERQLNPKRLGLNKAIGKINKRFNDLGVPMTNVNS